MQLGYSFSTSGDTEVLLAGYKEWGKDIVHKLKWDVRLCNL